MGLSEIDGFLAGIVVGPELILPSEWLPVIWGGNEPQFQTDSEIRTVVGTIMGRYNEIVVCCNGDPDEFDPIFGNGQRARSSHHSGHPVSLTPLHCVERRGNCSSNIIADGVVGEDDFSRGIGHDPYLHCRYSRVLAESSTSQHRSQLGGS
jgi:hypothetical protein